MAIKLKEVTHIYNHGTPFEKEALSDINLHIPKGQFVGLIGHTGSGKSTLIQHLNGLMKPAKGTVYIHGKDIHSKQTSLKDIRQQVGLVFQYPEYQLFEMTIYKDVAFGPKNMGLTEEEIKTRVNDALAMVGIGEDMFEKSPFELSGGQKRRVAIAGVLAMNPEILILDEPTSSLDEQEVEKLFKVMNKLKAQGIGIIFVTHYLEQVYKISDRITVLRNGVLVGEYETSKLPSVQLVAKMMGKEYDELSTINSKDFVNEKTDNQEEILHAKQLGRTGTIKPFDFTIHKGEVVGFSGLLGSGRSEMSRVIYGADKADTGELIWKGKKININVPIDAMKVGMAYLPENRMSEGIISELSVRENIIIALQVKNGIWNLMSRKDQEEFADKYINLLQIKTPNLNVPIKQLSGGNQQKVILARWLLTNPDFMILDEPTRGIDVGTKMEIQKLVLQLSDKGKSIVFISSEIEEMLRVCSRLIILRDGCKVGELEKNELDQNEIMNAIAGGGGR